MNTYIAFRLCNHSVGSIQQMARLPAVLALQAQKLDEQAARGREARLARQAAAQRQQQQQQQQ